MKLRFPKEAAFPRVATENLLITQLAYLLRQIYHVVLFSGRRRHVWLPLSFEKTLVDLTLNLQKPPAMPRRWFSILEATTMVVAPGQQSRAGRRKGGGRPGKAAILAEKSPRMTTGWPGMLPFLLFSALAAVREPALFIFPSC